MTIAENIKRARTDIAHMTQEEFGKIAGVSSMAVSQWENGRAVPRMGAVERIAQALSIPKSYIIDNISSKCPFPNAIKPQPAKTAPVPLYGRVHAGKPCDPIVYDDEKIEIPAHLLDLDPETYALISEGDCMNNIYPEGCTIAVAPNLPPSNGSVAVVSIDGRDAVMRRLYRTAHTLILAPDSTNPEHEDIVITDDSDHTVEFLGRVIWFQARRVMD